METNNQIARINNAQDHGLILGDLSLSIKEALEKPSLNQLIAQGAKESQIEALLAVLLLKYSSRLNVGGNLKPGQAIEFAKELLSDWPTMSLDDFNIMLSNGSKGRYNEPGKLFRFDLAVLYDWIGCYQEKYWELKEKVKVSPPSLDDVLSDEQLEKLKEIVKDSNIQGVRPMTIDEIWKEGKAKKDTPKAITADRQYSGWDKIELVELKTYYGRECRDINTGKLLEGMPTLEEWLKGDRANELRKQIVGRVRDEMRL